MASPYQARIQRKEKRASEAKYDVDMFHRKMGMTKYLIRMQHDHGDGRDPAPGYAEVRAHDEEAAIAKARRQYRMESQDYSIKIGNIEITEIEVIEAPKPAGPTFAERRAAQQERLAKL